MKITCSADINVPIDNAVELFSNTDNLKKWQDGFQTLTHLSGEPGKPGAKSEIIFINKGHIIKLSETIQVANLPKEWTALYEHSHGANTNSSTFEKLSDKTTRYSMTTESIHIIGLLPKIMAALMPGMFKKHTQKWVDNFKAFAEREYAG